MGEQYAGQEETGAGMYGSFGSLHLSRQALQQAQHNGTCALRCPVLIGLTKLVARLPQITCGMCIKLTSARTSHRSGSGRSSGSSRGTASWTATRARADCAPGD